MLSKASKQSLANAALVCVVTASMLIGAELFVRAMLRPAPSDDPTVVGESFQSACTGLNDPYDTEGQCYFSTDAIAKLNFSTYFGFVPAPGAKGRGYVTNSWGMRYDEDFPASKPPSEQRVFVTGGSTAWGAGVRQDQLFTAKAEHELGASQDSHVRVISAGVGGYVSLQEVLRYIVHVRKLHPDIWVMFTGWNDVYAGYRGARYYESPDLLDLHNLINRGAPDDPILRTRLLPRPGDAEYNPRGPLWGAYSLKLNWLVEKAVFRLRSRKEGRPSEIGPATGGAQPMPAEVIVDNLIQNVTLAAALSRRDGARLVVCLQPSLYSTAKHMAAYELTLLQEADKSYPDLPKYFHQLYPAMREALAAAAQKGDFVFLDSDQAIAAEEKAVFADHVHFGDRGNAQLGRFLADKLAPLLH